MSVPDRFADESTRAYIYRVALSAGSVASFYGVLSESEVAVWAGLAGVVLATGGNALAAVKTKTRKGVRR